MSEYNSYRLQDLKDGLQTILDQLEAMGFPYPTCADFKVTVVSRKGRPEFSVSFSVMQV
jgi:hypothetical protein